MNNFKKFFSFLMCATFLFITFSQTGVAKDNAFPMPGPGQIPGLPQLSDAEMKQIQAEMEALEKQLSTMKPEEQQEYLGALIDEGIQALKEELSDEERELFDKLERGDISEEEFFNKFMAEEPAEEKPAQKATPKPKAEPKPVITSKHQEALNRIDSLIKHTNLFLQKAGNIPEMPSKITKWETKKSITWQSGLTWNIFRSKLDKFVSQLQKLKEKDPKTKAYYHLDNLLKDISLYNNLSKIEAKAAELEPRIEEVAPIGGQKMKAESKAALQQLISQYIEALYTLNLSEELEKLFTKFEPKAKEKREAEEAARKKAESEQKKVRRPGRAVTGGIPEEEYDYPDPYDYDFDDAVPYMPSADGEPFVPTYEAPAETGLGVSQSKFGAPGAKPSKKAPMAKGKKTPEDDGEKLPTAAALKKEEKPIRTAMTPELKKAVKKEKQTIKHVDFAMEDAMDFLKTEKSLSNIQAEVPSVDPYSKKLVNEVLPDFQQALRKAKKEIDKVKQDLKNKPADQKQRFANLIKKEVGDYNKLFNPFIQQLQALENNKDQLSMGKQYVYFAEKINMAEYLVNQLTTVFSGDDLGTFMRIFEQTRNFQMAKDQFIKKLAKSDPLVSNLETIAETVSQLEKLEIEVPNPISLSDIKRQVQEIKQAMDTLGK